MADRVVPSHLYPLVRAFLATNGFASTAAAFDKELGSNKVAKEVDGDLFEIYKEYVKAHPELVAPKRKAEDEAEKPSKKAKVEKEEKEKEKEDKKSKKSKKDESSDSESSSDDSSESESSDSDSSSSSGSDSDSDSDSDSSSSSSDDSSSDSDSSSSSDSSSDSESSDSSSDEKSKKKNKKDKKEKKEKTDKETNGAAEAIVAVTPTGSKKNAPFRRVTDEDASYLVEKFSDNTFESKKGDGYGAKANEILSQVRGKGFRTEKNKKKKGTYRGGPIDLGINSIKYTYDD